MVSSPSNAFKGEKCIKNTFCDQSSTYKSKRLNKKRFFAHRKFKSGIIGFISFGSVFALTCIVILTFSTTATLGDNLQQQESLTKNELIENIRNELTKLERHTIFGSPHLNDGPSKAGPVPEFDIISPQIFHHKSKRKRSTIHSPQTVPFPSPALSKSQEGSHSDSEDKLVVKIIQIDGLGRKFDLTLRPNFKILDPDFVYLFRHENSSEILPEHHVRKKLHCFYQGTAYNYPAEETPTIPSPSSGFDKTNQVSSGPVALNICGGLDGSILSSNGNSEQEHYIIRPVPDRLHMDGKLAHKNHHFLWKRDTNVNKHRNGMTREQVEKANPSNVDDNLQKGILVNESSSKSSEVDSLTSALPFYTASSTDNNEREVVTKPRSSADKTEEILDDRYQSNDDPENHSAFSVIESINKVHREHWEENFFGPSWKSSLDSDFIPPGIEFKASTIGETGKDYGSSSPSTITIEIAVFVDKDLYKHMESNFPEDTQGEVTRIVLAMINEVQLLYQDPSLGHKVEFVLKRLEVLDSDPPGLLRPYDIDRFLTNFCKWQRTENPTSDADPLHWDHALMLTGLDLYTVHSSGKISNQVVGLSPVSGMCTRSSSCSVNELRHFESTYVIAHEIGHNLGMRHDGPQADNDCDPTGHLMSPALSIMKSTWSSCSKQYLEKFLELTQSKCLIDRARPESRLDHDADSRLPGERFDADRQCVLKYGRGSYHAKQQPLEDVCRDIHCRREHYTWTSHSALEGTYCGLNMWCRRGKCVHRETVPVSSFEQNANFKDFNANNPVGGSETATYSTLKALNGGWGKWSLFTDCSSACLYSNEGSLSMGSTGIQLSVRRCDNPRPENGGTQCSGPDRRYKTCCTNKLCTFGGPRKTITQYANEVCIRAANVDAELTGRGLMANTNDPERACSVWCEIESNGGSRSRGWSFPDGTACKIISQINSASYYCVAGKCQEFSCSSDSGFKLSDEECSFTSTNEVTPRSWFGGASTGSNIASSSSSLSIYRTTKADGSNWKPQSECKLACLAPAKGLQLVKRSCADGESHCVGIAVSVRLCKPDKAMIQMNGCTRLQTLFEYATKICNKYSVDIKGLSGIGMQLSATKEDPDRPCRIGCQDNKVSYRFYMVNGEEGWFPTGTDCSRGDPNKKVYCLRGKCIDFGNDDTPIRRINSTLLEGLFQRSKRQTVYNIKEPLQITHYQP